MIRAVGRWIDQELQSAGMTRRDLRIRFGFRGRRWYIETFNPLWWVLSVTGVLLAVILCYVTLVAILIMVPAH